MTFAPEKAGRPAMHSYSSDAEREQVAPPVHLPAARLLGRKIQRRADDHVAARLHRQVRQRVLAGLGLVLLVELLRQTEVQDLHLAALVDDHVRGLDVAVHHAAPVRRRQRLGHVGHDLDRAREVQPRARQNLAERLARHQLHHDVRLTGLRLAVVVHGGDVPVTDRRDGPRLAQEPRPVVLLVRPRQRKLDRHAPPEPRVLRHVHHAHPPLANLAEDAVMRDGLPDHVLRNAHPRARTRKGLVPERTPSPFINHSGDQPTQRATYSPLNPPPFQDTRQRHPSSSPQRTLKPHGPHPPTHSPRQDSPQNFLPSRVTTFRGQPNSFVQSMYWDDLRPKTF